MPRTFKDLIIKIERDGWYLVAQNGSHRQYKHPSKKGRVTIAAHKLSDDVNLKTEKSILKQAGLIQFSRGDTMYKNYPDEYIFPALIEQCKNCYNVTFPDLPGCVASGTTIKEAITEAREGLALHLWGFEQDGEQVPQSSFCDVQADANAIICYIDVNMFGIRAKMDSRCVKKTLTIPWYLNELAEQKRINFSQLLQTALKERLGVC